MLPRLTCSALQQDLDEEANHKSLTAKPLRETANMISFCADAIVRDDMYLGASNAYMREVGCT